MTNEIATRPVVKATAEMDVPYFEIPITKDTRTVTQFLGMLKLFKFNDPIQRNANAWTIEGKSLLIISLIEGISIGHVKIQVIRKSQMKYRNVLDGKQRLLTIRDFVQGKFPISCSRYVNGFDEQGNSIWVDINGCYFNDLPIQYQNRISGTIIEIEEYDIDDSMKFELFQRWNNGVALKPSQLRKSRMSNTVLFALAGLKEREIFKVGFSEASINSDIHADAILQGMALILTDNQTSLDSRTLNKMLEEQVFSSAILNEITEIANYLEKVYAYMDESLKKSAFNKSKTVSLIYIARLAKRNDLEHQVFMEWMTKFFIEDYASSGFSTMSGTAKLDNVRRRNDIIQKHFKKFLKNIQQGETYKQILDLIS